MKNLRFITSMILFSVPILADAKDKAKREKGFNTYKEDSIAIQKVRPNDKKKLYDWGISVGIKHPGAMARDPETEHLLLANIVGNPTERNNLGFVSRYSAAGIQVRPRFVTGLNAPKGIAVFNRTIWIADIDHVVAASLRNGRIKMKIPCKGASALTGLAISADGRIYIADPLTNRIYKVYKKKCKVWRDDDELNSPSGLHVDRDRLWVAAWGLTKDWTNSKLGSLYYINLFTNERIDASRVPFGNLYGITTGPLGDPIVSDWKGSAIWKVNLKGQKTRLFHKLKNPGDLLYIKDTGTLVITRIVVNRVIGVRIKKHIVYAQPFEDE